MSKTNIWEWVLFTKFLQTETCLKEQCQLNSVLMTFLFHLNGHLCVQLKEKAKADANDGQI